MKDKNQIKGIIFDWGGVCCKEGEPFALKALQFRLSMSPEEIMEKTKDICLDYYTGRYNSQEFWQAIMHFFGLKEDTAINPKILSRAYLDSYEIYPKIFNLILKLKKRYKLGLLSNLTPEMRDRIQTKHDLDVYFDAQVYSCDADVRSIKPDRKPYERILKIMKLKPANCLFIDNSEKNIKAGKKIGFKTILFRDVDKFLAESEFLH